ncbi:hypothetical protein AQS70_07780 [Pseudomonas endophytica]|uniref:Uncharacterized protein n=1 Tax=Pseudomonas endophytica TaxID=1563157 RepID=A0A0Q0SQR0_9PSED|nr:hypothetical protein [Pseudomonas endophytica]KQB54345.1 hypothetical protein AQS70_07780 [Pseudomonas endophytica]
MTLIMTNMTQKDVPVVASGVSSELIIKLETTGEKERFGARVEAVMGVDSKVKSIFMSNAQYGFRPHSNGRDAHWHYAPSFNSEHWKPEISIDVICRNLPAYSSVIEIGTFTYYSADNIKGVTTPLKVRAAYDPNIKLDLQEELLATWEDYSTNRRVYSHKIRLDLPDDNLSHWSVSFKVSPGTVLFKKPWTAYTHDLETGVVEFKWFATKSNIQTELREVDFQLLSTSLIYNPALEKLASLTGYYVMAEDQLVSDLES